jgi:hypothetical protein
MSIGSYPRVTVQGSGTGNNVQNGQGLMILNPSTNKYEAVTANTFNTVSAGGATASNQTTEITALNSIDNSLRDYLEYDSTSAAEYLFNILLQITNINTLLTDGTAKVILVDTAGISVKVSGSEGSGQLNVKVIS